MHDLLQFRTLMPLPQGVRELAWIATCAVLCEERADVLDVALQQLERAPIESHVHGLRQVDDPTSYPFKTEPVP